MIPVINVPFDPRAVSETDVQALARLMAPHRSQTLWRNNVGVLKDVTGRPVRYGLANESKALNESIKSGDLIGWETVIITPAMVGQAFARFVSRECKRPNYVLGSTQHEIAQARWAKMVIDSGGDAAFVTMSGDPQ